MSKHSILLICLSSLEKNVYTIGPITILNHLQENGIKAKFYNNILHSQITLEDITFYQSKLNLNINTLNKKSQDIANDIDAQISNETKLVCFTLVYGNIFASLFFSKYLKLKYPNINIGIGGPLFFNDLHINSYEFFKYSFLDFFMRGDGKELITKIHFNNYSFNDMTNETGFNFRYKNKWHINNETNKTKPINYKPQILNHDDIYNIQNVTFSTGCPFKCSFCTAHMYYNHHISAPVEKCIEILMPYRNKRICIVDALCNGNNNWLKNFCDRLIESKLNIIWESWFRINQKLTEYSFIELLYNSGCREMTFGFESASGSVLNHMKKFSDEKAIYAIFNNIRKLRKNNKYINLHLNIIVGYPTETEKDFQKTYNFILFNRDVITSIASCNILSFSEDLKLYNDLINENILTYDNHLNWSTPHSSLPVRLDRSNKLKKLFNKLNLKCDLYALAEEAKEFLSNN